VIVRAYPDGGQEFEGWSFDPPDTNAPSLLTNNPITVLIDTNRTLIAHFTKRPWIEVVRCQGELVAGLFRMKVHGKLLEVYSIEASPTLTFRSRSLGKKWPLDEHARPCSTKIRTCQCTATVLPARLLP